MGKVIVKEVILRNHEDETLCKNNVIQIPEIREMKADMIADTGATIVCLSSPLVKKLGLPAVNQVSAKLADGSSVKKTVYGDLTVRINDREGVFKCVDNGEHAPLLLGQIVFEDLSLVVDCVKCEVSPHPESTDGSLFYELF